VTYNFDPDKWYANRRAALERQRDEGALGAEAYAQALADLEARHEELTGRQDAGFALPPDSSGR
jgi:hypothetical protein